MSEKTLSQREKAFKELVEQQPFPPDIREEFYEYWTEPNKSESKMRFELEKTWHLGRRMKRWQLIRDSRKDFTKREVAAKSKPLAKPPENDFERLEALFTMYSIRPVAIKFEVFGLQFNFMKENNLLKELSQEEKDILKLVYGNNGEKLRCAWVQKTLDGFMITGFPKRLNYLKAV